MLCHLTAGKDSSAINENKYMSTGIKYWKTKRISKMGRGGISSGSCCRFHYKQLLTDNSKCQFSSLEKMGI